MATLPTAPQAELRGRRLLLPLALLWLIAAGTAWLLFMGAAVPSTALGATAGIPGGLARVNEVTSVEQDVLLPGSPGTALAAPAAAGAHRVRVVVQMTALDAAGIDFDAADYAIEGLGVVHPEALWSSPASLFAAKGTTVQVTLVFEVPDRAVALVLVDGAGTRLSLGSGHHAGGL